MEPSEEKIKEIYARFGLAYYLSECLHRNLCILWALCQFSDPGHITRPRIEEHLSKAYSFTLGALVNEVSPLLHAELNKSLNEALEMRNFLAHHFWFERVHLMTASGGVAQLIDELRVYENIFQKVDNEIDNLTGPLLKRIGVTQEVIENSLRLVLDGKGESLLHRRRLRKQEILVAIYDVPIGEKSSTLIFETNDQCLWQLCDIGLGWTRFDTVESTWKRNSLFDPYLPTTINPRPDLDSPWNYEITLKGSASLKVTLGPHEKQFRWTLRKPPNQSIHPAGA